MTEENKLHQIFFYVSLYLSEGGETQFSEYTHDIIKITPKTIRYREIKTRESVLHKKMLNKIIETDSSIRNTYVTGYKVYCLTEDKKEMIKILGEMIKQNVHQKVLDIAKLHNIVQRDIDKAVLSRI